VTSQVSSAAPGPVTQALTAPLAKLTAHNRNPRHLTKVIEVPLLGL